MIEAIRGRLLGVEETAVIVEAGGVSFRLECPQGVCESMEHLRLGAGDDPEVRIFAHLIVRADAWQLFGFRDAKQRGVFRTLLDIPGIGPRLAMSLLSHLSWQEMCQAVAGQDPARFQAVPGIGKRTAARILVELTGKVDADPVGQASPVSATGSEAVEALVALGIARAEAAAMVSAVQRASDDELPTAKLISEALRRR